MNDFNRLLHVINLETLFIWGVNKQNLSTLNSQMKELRTEFIKTALQSGFIELHPDESKEYHFTSEDRQYANFYVYPQRIADLLSSIVRFANLETGEVKYFLPKETQTLFESVKDELNSLVVN